MQHTVEIDVVGPWSLATSTTFWEGFAPASLTPSGNDSTLRTAFRVEADWSRADVTVTQAGSVATLTLRGEGDLEAAAGQVCRFLGIDIDADPWPEVALRDPVIADAQQRLPGLRPCGFHSPYEAASWAVLSQRLRIVQAARLREDFLGQYGEGGTFPAPDVLRSLDLDLPGRKAEYLQAVAQAALDGILDGPALRAVDPAAAIGAVQQVKGLGPFGAELVVIRGANAPDVLPHHERRLAAEVHQRYGPSHSLEDVAEAWRPFRTWGAVHLRALRERRTQEISGHPEP